MHSEYLPANSIQGLKLKPILTGEYDSVWEVGTERRIWWPRTLFVYGKVLSSRDQCIVPAPKFRSPLPITHGSGPKSGSIPESSLDNISFRSVSVINAPCMIDRVYKCSFVSRPLLLNNMGTALGMYNEARLNVVCMRVHVYLYGAFFV